MDSKILIEAEKLKDLYCGLGQYCLHLTNSLSEHSKEISTFCYRDLRGTAGDFVEVKRWVRKVPKTILRALSFLLPKVDLWHVTHQDSEYFYVIKAKKIVLTIHDLNFMQELSIEKSKQRHAKLQQLINSSDAIVYISNFTKNEVQRCFNIPQQLIQRVIYNGVSFSTQQEDEITRLKGKKFLFSIGTIVAKKNFHVLLELLPLLPAGTKIVIAGSLAGEYADKLQARIKSTGQSDSFLLIGKISEGEKRWLYANCQAFIFPSLLEGFGIPIIEAMSYGCPLFLSNKTSIPEIGGEDAFYLDDFTPVAMAKVIADGLDSFNQMQSVRLRQRAKQFSWKVASSAYYKLYQELLVK